MKKIKVSSYLAGITTFLLLSAEKVFATVDTASRGLQTAYGIAPSQPAPSYEEILSNPKIWGFIMVPIALAVGLFVGLGVGAKKWRKNKNDFEY